MKREGRQHGLVQTYQVLSSPWNPRSEGRRINKIDSPPTAGLFTKVSQKPTNHSKFTGKCGRPRCASCHIHPAGKAKDKTKGTQKLRSCDVVTNYRLVTWRVVDARPGLNFSGFSATGILNHLASECIDYGDEIYDDGDYGIDYDDGDYGLNNPDDDGDYGLNNPDWTVAADTEIASGAVEIEEVNDCDCDYNAAGDDDEDKMSFCDVDFVWEQRDGDEGWCLVGEI